MFSLALTRALKPLDSSQMLFLCQEQAGFVQEHGLGHVLPAYEKD